MGERCCHFS